MRIKKGQTVNESIQAWMWPRSARSKSYGELKSLQSELLFETTTERLGLDQDPEFNGSMPRSWADHLISLDIFWPVVGYFRSLTGQNGKRNTTRTDNHSVATDILMGTLTTRLDTGGLGRSLNTVDRNASRNFDGSIVSKVFSVTAKSVDPQKAADIANTFADVYMTNEIQRRVRDIRVARTRSSDRRKQLLASITDSERAIDSLLSSKILAGDGYNVTSAGLAAAKTDYEEQKMRLAHVQKLLESGQGIIATKEAQRSPLIQRLRSHEARLLHQIGELGQEIGEHHPKLKNLRAKLSTTRRGIGEEQIKLVQELESELRVAGARVRTHLGELNFLDAQRRASSRDLGQLRQLQREVEVKEKIYEKYMRELEESVTNVALENEVLYRVISPAVASVASIYPHRSTIMTFGFFVSLGLGMIFVLVFERLDCGFRSAAQVLSTIGIPVLGIIPKLASAEKDGRAPSDAILTAPGSPYSEAIRSVRTALTLTNIDAPPKIVLVASALPGEGKTSLSVSLARHAAMSSVSGKVILVDCDLRRPTVSAVMRLRANAGLTELLTGQADLDEVLKIDSRSGLHVLPAVSGHHSPADILNSRSMCDLLAQLSTNYDLVIIDSPAIDSVSDSRILAHMAHATIFVVQRLVTPRRKVIDSLRKMASAGARNAAVVLQGAEQVKRGRLGLSQYQRA